MDTIKIAVTVHLLVKSCFASALFWYFLLFATSNV